MLGHASSQSVKVFGVVVAALLVAFGLVIAKAGSFERVSDKYASAFYTVALLVFLVAVGGFARPPTNQLLEASGYVVGGAAGTAAFARIARNKSLFERA